MTTDEKVAFAEAASMAIEHPMFRRKLAILLRNLKVPPDGLEDHSIREVAVYAAVIARAHALFMDPDSLRMTPDESTDQLVVLVQAFQDAGKPTIVVGSGGEIA